MLCLLSFKMYRWFVDFFIIDDTLQRCREALFTVHQWFTPYPSAKGFDG
jgi:hypothetical protein